MRLRAVRRSSTDNELQQVGVELDAVEFRLRSRRGEDAGLASMGGVAVDVFAKYACPRTSFGRLPGRGDFVRDNAGQVLTAVVALLVAVVGFASAEGGFRRRSLRQAKEELELHEELGKQDLFGEHRARLHEVLDDRLRTYLLPTRARVWRRLRHSALAFATAAVIFSLIDLGRAVIQDANSTPATAYILASLLGVALGLAILGLVSGMLDVLFRILRWAWGRGRVRGLEKRVHHVRERVERFEEREQAH